MGAAARLCVAAHGNQRRKTGGPYFSHLFDVAAMLADCDADDVTISAGLCHDILEDTKGLPRVAVTGWLCGLEGLWGHDGFVFGGGQSAESGLSSASVVGAFDPGDDRDAELVAGVPAAGVEHVLL